MKWIRLTAIGASCLAVLLASHWLLNTAQDDWESLEGLWLGLVGVGLAIVFSAQLDFQTRPRSLLNRRGLR